MTQASDNKYRFWRREVSLSKAVHEGYWLCKACGKVCQPTEIEHPDWEPDQRECDLCGSSHVVFYPPAIPEVVFT